MALMDHKTTRVEVPLGPDNSMSVRGLDLDDFSALLQTHLEPISKATDLYSRSKADIYSTKNLQGFVLSVVKDFPGLVSEVISIAADEPEARHVRIGLGFQLSAISAILKLTLEEAGGMGNLLATLAALARGAGLDASKLSPQPIQSRGSIGDSEKTLAS